MRTCEVGHLPGHELGAEEVAEGVAVESLDVDSLEVVPGLEQGWHGELYLVVGDVRLVVEDAAQGGSEGDEVVGLEGGIVDDAVYLQVCVEAGELAGDVVLEPGHDGYGAEHDADAEGDGGHGYADGRRAGGSAAVGAA